MGKVDVVSLHGRDLVKDTILRLPINEIWRGDRTILLVVGWTPFPDVDDLIRVRVWERPQQDGFNQAEHRSIGANAQGKRQYNNQCESRVLVKQPECMPQIASKLLHHIPPFKLWDEPL